MLLRILDVIPQKLDARAMVDDATVDRNILRGLVFRALIMSSGVGFMGCGGDTSFFVVCVVGGVLGNSVDGGGSSLVWLFAVTPLSSSLAMWIAILGNGDR